MVWRPEDLVPHTSLKYGNSCEPAVLPMKNELIGPNSFSLYNARF